MSCRQALPNTLSQKDSVFSRCDRNGGPCASDRAIAAAASNYGMVAAARQRNTTDAVVVLSVFLNPATGSFDRRSKYASFSAR